MLHHDSVAAHLALSTREFLMKLNILVILHLLNSPD
jgi:hypothetical protein